MTTQTTDQIPLPFHPFSFKSIEVEQGTFVHGLEFLPDSD